MRHMLGLIVSVGRFHDQNELNTGAEWNKQAVPRVVQQCAGSAVAAAAAAADARVVGAAQRERAALSAT
ncbi:hypothetical protein EVAR_32402_1 [Eumeta japonica]|uniref:Uncharacterized protein n=1 Tax=Eumeta variegata TaxID=151549 RepID=A0A4C1VIT7_EUMVA|nr:hypothetical protein EVAR_32402_1 [Eumeta japonica]